MRSLSSSNCLQIFHLASKVLTDISDISVKQHWWGVGSGIWRASKPLPSLRVRTLIPYRKQDCRWTWMKFRFWTAVAFPRALCRSVSVCPSEGMYLARRSLWIAQLWTTAKGQSLNFTGISPARFMVMQLGWILRNITRVNARLKQYVSYKGDSFWGFTDTKETSVEVNRLEKTDPIAPGTTALWHNERLHIPSLPPRLVGCSIIDVSYLLKVDVDNYISATIPVILGTVPVSDPRRLSLATTQTSHSEAPPPYCETPPPSYRQCILGSFSIEEDGDDEHTMGDRFFVPKYVYYGVV